VEASDQRIDRGGGDAAAALRLTGLSKEYPGVRALHDVSFAVRRARVHALVGENGAGKSTLISLIAGTNHPSAGEIEIDGTVYPALTPRLATSFGIRLVPQERQVCNDLSVAENVLLGRVPKRGGFVGPVDHRAMNRQAHELLLEVGLGEIDPRVRMRDLTVVQAQLVEVARALSARARLIIMDEPTAALGGSDVETLFGAIRRLRDRGVSFLYVSHHLEEIFDIADDVTVLRDGDHVVTRPLEGLTMDGLVELLLGRSPEEIELEGSGRSAGEVVMEIEDLHVQRLHGVSLAVNAGEILAVTGAIGSGKRELARALVGIVKPDRGEVRIAGKGPVRGPGHAVSCGIALLPEDRKNEGILAALSVGDNIGLGRLAARRRLLSLPRQRRRDAHRMVDELGVRTPSVHQPIRLLSGGNQQKALLGRWLNVGVRALVLDGPTEGIDIGSRLEIYALLRKLAADGVAIAIFSSDFEEVKLVADRVVALRRGRVAGELRGGEISEERLYALQYGKSAEEVGSR
jgi:ribose transport system ATP-binding protein